MSESALPPALPDPVDAIPVWARSSSNLRPRWGESPPAFDEERIPWHRYLAALKRYRWLILAISVAGAALGVAATHLLPPKYEVHATVWVASSPGPSGPVRAEEFLDQRGWAELVEAFSVLDPVVREERLYLRAGKESQSLFSGFGIADTIYPGSYRLRLVDGDRKYRLENETGEEIETGEVGDSIGRRLGFLWQPSPDAWPAADLKFSLVSPREAAVELQRELLVSLPDQGNFMRLTLAGPEAFRATRILNAIADRFVAVAADLRAFKLRETTRILEEQLASVGSQLRTAEGRLESYKTSIITLPSEDTPVAAGIQMTQPTVISRYFNEKIEVDRLQRERDALRQVLDDAGRSGVLNVAGLQSLDLVRQSPPLVQALSDLTTAEAELRGLRLHYTDQARSVQTARERVETLRTTTVPDEIRQVIASAEAKTQEIQTHLSSASAELRRIPERAIQEQRLDRERQSLATIYTDLQARYQAARLAEATAIPDVKILDRAIQPQKPTKDLTRRIMFLAILAGLGAGVGLAILLDRLDHRVQYPEQVSEALGLSILGAIPAIRRKGSGELPQDQAALVVESFRSVRLNLAHAFDKASGVSLTISSPGAGDGKSLVSSNLAVSFASAGYQTVLIDGDIRRGEMHRMFGVDRRPGLLDFLQGEAAMEDVLRPTSQPGLWLLPCGTRRQHGPELLGAPGMATLLGELRRRFNAVLIDSPPLEAGVDPLILSAATGNMVLVIRSGETDRRMAEAKLPLVERLPIRILGAVLNDVQAGGVYRYYGYAYGYASTDEKAALPAGSGPPGRA